MGGSTSTEPLIADARRFRVRADAFYVRHRDGVWLRNNAGSFSIQGAGAYQLVDSLLANLDGRRELEEVVGGLPDAARKSVLRLVDLLERNGFIRQVEYPAEVVPDWMQERYPAQLAFLEHHADQPVARMTRVRSRLVTCVGDGVALRSLLAAAGEFGLAKVLVVTTAAGVDQVAGVVDRARERDPQLRWRTLVQGPSPDLAEIAGRPELADTAQVLLAFDRDDDAYQDAVASFQQTLRRRGTAVGVLGRCGDFVVSTLASTDVDWCWRCVSASIAAPVTGDAADLPPAATPAAIGALHLVQHAFTELAGVELDDRRTVTTVEPLAPVVRTHRARRHPLCRRHDQPSRPAPVDPVGLAGEPVRPDVPASQDPPGLVAIADRIVAVTSAWTDRVTGPLLALGEGDADQLPLSASGCVVADPLSTASAQITHRVWCRALSPREARNQVVLFALEWLAGRVASCLDPTTGAGLVHGAGWTPAEAWYRAQVAASLDLPAAAPRWAEVPDQAEHHGPIRQFLTGTLAAAGHGWQASSIERLPAGLVRATVRTAGDVPARGVGIDVDHALDNALLRAAGLMSPPADAAQSARTALLAPPVGSWADAVAAMVGTGRPAEAVDVSAAIPFLDGDAFVFAMPAKGVGR